MLSARPEPRTSTLTSALLCERKTAAWPAELPPPTMAISSPLHSWASTWVALYMTPVPSNRASSGSAGLR